MAKITIATKDNLQKRIILLKLNVSNFYYSIIVKGD